MLTVTTWAGNKMAIFIHILCVYNITYILSLPDSVVMVSNIILYVKTERDMKNFILVKAELGQVLKKVA